MNEHDKHRSHTIDLMESHAKKGKMKRFLQSLGGIVFDAVVIVGLVLLLRSYIMAPFRVHGTSMCDTLNFRNEECQTGYGEYLIINKFQYIIGEPKRGDIVVFRPPGVPLRNQLESLIRNLLRVDGQEYYIKRIIGLPGETVELRDGQVFIINKENPKGMRLDETYLNEENKGNTEPLIPGKTTFKVPQARYFALGDNRRVSTDGRSCFRSSFIGGCRSENDHYLSKEAMEGRAWIILYPLEKIGILKNPWL